jgi:ribosome-associated translation inhibitor RaiA
MTNHQPERLIGPIWDDQAASRVAVAMSAMVSETLKLSATLTSHGKDHHVLMQIADVYRAIDVALEAIERLEKQVRAGRASAEERREVAKVKAGLRPEGEKQ